MRWEGGHEGNKKSPAPENLQGRELMLRGTTLVRRNHAASTLRVINTDSRAL